MVRPALAVGRPTDDGDGAWRRGGQRDVVMVASPHRRTVMVGSTKLEVGEGGCQGAVEAISDRRRRWRGRGRRRADKRRVQIKGGGERTCGRRQLVVRPSNKSRCRAILIIGEDLQMTCAL
jgi:hypothetical protein